MRVCYNSHELVKTNSQKPEGGASYLVNEHCTSPNDDAIKPYFIEAGKALKYGNLRCHVACSMEKKPYPPLPEAMQEHSFWSFGSIEEHFQYREALMKAYPHGHFPVFEQPLPFLREEN